MITIYLNDTATTAEIDDRSISAHIVTGADTTYLKDSQIVLRLATRGAFILQEDGALLLQENRSRFTAETGLVASGDLIEVRI